MVITVFTVVFIQRCRRGMAVLRSLATGIVRSELPIPPQGSCRNVVTIYGVLEEAVTLYTSHVEGRANDSVVLVAER
ncbi:hypothetical protein E4U17_006245 [Claviceps sp. LM77 group G4]|nr:hypothetical protein E4U17_006245 [Claviceps sp. LM77 group G4]KAG6084227.1 hypothetical protein E4U33_003667 [Claviceps sp. LM78 group G4]KAG6085419.1 hypothetical protein E4U16_005390 [Claviceps sp. LM84 group G4]